MPPIDKHTPGSFCWFELATTDQPAAKQFYQSLFEWDVQDSPVGPNEFRRRAVTRRARPVRADRDGTSANVRRARRSSRRGVRGRGLEALMSKKKPLG